MTGRCSKHNMGTGNSVNLLAVLFFFFFPHLTPLVHILQAVVECHWEGTKEEFWAEFQDTKGRYLSFTASLSFERGAC